MANQRKRKEAVQLCSTIQVGESPYGGGFSWDPRWGSAGTAGTAGTGDVSVAPSNADFKQARRWAIVNPFVAEILRLRLFFYNYGMLGTRRRLKNPQNPKSEILVEYLPGILPINRSDAEKLNDWKFKHRVAITKYFQTAWKELLVINNLIGFWREGASPITLDPEKCTYTDAFGVEVLTVNHGMSHAEIDEMKGLPEAQKKRMKQSSTLRITAEDELFHFDVVKCARAGKGLAWPTLTALFHTCAMHENLEVSDRELADACRVVYEHHLCGHEIKSGMRAGAKDNFLREERAKKISKDCKNSKGKKLLVTNFDHAIKIGHGLPDPKQFASSRYDAVLSREAQWAMPIGQMVLGKTVNPFLMTLLRTQAHGEREVIGPHFERILRDGFRCKIPFQLQWDSTIFWDSRLMLDVLKTVYNGGALSQGTLTETTGFDRTHELSAKADEAKLPFDMRAPAYDPAHGDPQAQGGKGGKPPGTIDAS
jgi:hypothetical protein